jgi:hypothetical protein
VPAVSDQLWAYSIRSESLADICQRLDGPDADRVSMSTANTSISNWYKAHSSLLYEGKFDEFLGQRDFSDKSDELLEYATNLWNKIDAGAEE